MKNQFSSLPEETTGRERGAYRIAIILLVVLVGFDIFSTYGYIEQQASQLPFAMISSYAATVGIILCTWLIHQGWVNTAVWGLILITIIALALSLLLGGSLGIVLGVTAIVATTAIARHGLERHQTVWANAASLVFGIVAFLFDFFNSSNRSSNLNTGFTFITLFAFLLALMFVVSRQFRNYTIRIKLIILFLVTSIIPLCILTFINYSNSRTTLIDNANEKLASAASSSASQLDSYFTNNRTYAKVI